MKQIPNLGITFTDRAIEFLIKRLELDWENKSLSEIKTELCDKYGDGIIELLSQFGAYLRDYPFPGGMSEKSYRECIRKSIKQTL